MYSFCHKFASCTKLAELTLCSRITYHFTGDNIDDVDVEIVNIVLACRRSYACVACFMDILYQNVTYENEITFALQ